MKRNKKKFWMIFPFVIAAIGVFVWFFQWLWNILLPEILGVKSISYWQALGILVLSRILFGGFNGKKKFGRHNYYHWNEKDSQDRMKEMWRQQFCGTENDKEKFKKMWKQRFESKFCRPPDEEEI